jgi:YfiH family protein
MIKHVHGGTTYYTFELLAPYSELRHGVMTREGPDGQDWTFSYQDTADPGLVNANIDTACSILGLQRPASVHQVHGARPLLLAPHENYQPNKSEEVFREYDALISAFGHSLMIKLADCQGLIIYDPTSRTLSLVHSGWRGSVQNIIGCVVKTMVKTFKLDPKYFLACCGPSLGPCCAEFVNHLKELPDEFRAYKDDRDHFDFTAISRKQLIKAGLKDDNIEFSGICTRCSDEFYSYRRGDTGRFPIFAGVVDKAL